LLKKDVENALDRPASEPPKGGIPIAEARWQISPSGSGVRDPQNRLHKLAVICLGATAITHFTRKKRLNSLPLFVAQTVSIQHGSPFASLESDLA
jgi:hypothetical protein